MNRRAEIRLTPEEQEAFLRQPLKAALATVDREGFPHVVAMSFLARDGAIYMTSYAKAQKVLNIRRNPKVAVLVEDGREYAEFRGVMVRGHCEIIEDPALAAAVTRDIAAKRGGPGAELPGTAASAAKRVVLKVTPEKVVTWDHAKLGGRY